MLGNNKKCFVLVITPNGLTKFFPMGWAPSDGFPQGFADSLDKAQKYENLRGAQTSLGAYRSKNKQSFSKNKYIICQMLDDFSATKD